MLKIFREKIIFFRRNLENSNFQLINEFLSQFHPLELLSFQCPMCEFETYFFNIKRDPQKLMIVERFSAVCSRIHQLTYIIRFQVYHSNMFVTVICACFKHLQTSFRHQSPHLRFFYRWFAIIFRVKVLQSCEMINEFLRIPTLNVASLRILSQTVLSLKFAH